jgi:hypothetical protein
MANPSTFKVLSWPMIRVRQIVVAAFFSLVLAGCGGSSTSSGTMSGGTTPPPPSNSPFWAQWGANSQHSGAVAVVGQSLNNQLANIVYDPFTQQEQAENAPVIGEPGLLAHYQVPLIDGSDVYMVTESGNYISCNPVGAWAQSPLPACGPNAWSSKVWGETRYTWENSSLVKIWTYNSDWKPEPSGFGLSGWEPVFQPAEANGAIYVPGAGGTVWKVSKTDGSVTSHINPFGGTSVVATNTYVSSPLVADANGNVYYNVVQLADPSLGDPWVSNDIVGAWLVKVTPGDAASTVTYATLVPNAPMSSSQCPGTFALLADNGASLPWPPSTSAVPPTLPCGSQRPGINLAPAVGTDGTIYTASRAHFDNQVGYLVAVNPDLTLNWTASLQNILTDGCGVLVPIGATDTTPNSCRPGTNQGVDPTTNANGSALIVDQASSSPTVLPDGSILFPALTDYNGGRGHLLKFDPTGKFLSAFDFGWDSTPAVYSHDKTYSVVLKDNHYPAPLYCPYANNPLCPAQQPAYYITQLNPNLQIEWRFQNINTESCKLNPDGSMTCVSDHPNGFEWCVNAPAIDANGTVYANSEDGNLYTIPQGIIGTFAQPMQSIFLNLAIGAAYTPLSIGPDGKTYTENDGHMFVVGN